MTVFIGPYSRALSPSTVSSAQDATKLLSPSFAELFERAAPPQNDDFARSFESTGMFGGGLKVVSEATRVASPEAEVEPEQHASIADAPSSMSSGSTYLSPETQALPLPRPVPLAVPLRLSEPLAPNSEAVGSLFGRAHVSVISQKAADLVSGDDKTAPPAPRLPVATPSGSESTVRFAAQMTESGLRIQARLNQLDEDERDRLCDDVARMVGAHGITLDSLALNEVGTPNSLDYRE